MKLTQLLRLLILVKWNLLFIRFDDALCRRIPAYNRLRHQKLEIKNFGGVIA